MEDMPKGPQLRKLYYSIGEVSERIGVPTHVLRYWENEFPQLRPKKGRGGQRAYQHADLELLNNIKTLLYERKFTIAGAKVQLGKFTEEDSNKELIRQIREELRALLTILESSGRGAAR